MVGDAPAKPNKVPKPLPKPQTEAMALAALISQWKKKLLADMALGATTITKLSAVSFTSESDSQFAFLFCFIHFATIEGFVITEAASP